MATVVPTSQSRREAVQPSLWDRLVDELPGLVADFERSKATLSRTVGAERLERILDGGPRALEREPDLSAERRAEIASLIAVHRRKTFLEDRAVVVTPDVLREAVRRDIEALFNIERLESGTLLTDREASWFTPMDVRLADFPEVRKSVLNYGMPSFSGRTESDFDTEKLAAVIREALAVFEPRLRKDSIKVTVTFRDKAGMRIGIDATLMLSPVAERLRLSTMIDLDNGQATTRLEEV